MISLSPSLSSHFLFIPLFSTSLFSFSFTLLPDLIRSSNIHYCFCAWISLLFFFFITHPILFFLFFCLFALQVFKAFGGSSFPRDSLSIQTIHSDKACAVVRTRTNSRISTFTTTSQSSKFTTHYIVVLCEGVCGTKIRQTSSQSVFRYLYLSHSNLCWRKMIDTLPCYAMLFYAMLRYITRYLVIVTALINSLITFPNQ